MRSSTSALFAASSALLLLLVALDLKGRREAVVPAAERAFGHELRVSSETLQAPTLRAIGQSERSPIGVTESASIADSAIRDDRGSDVTVLRVRVMGPGGDPESAGNLECFAGERSFPETQALSIHLCVPIQSAVTELVLPASCLEAVLVASGSGAPPTLHREEDLRRLDDVFHVSGRVEKDVSISLQSDSAGSVVVGRILVDGIARVPEGLRVLLVRKPSHSASVEDALDRLPSLALVDRAARSYRAGPLSPAVRGLWATSVETVPCWIPIEWSEGQGDLHIDLDCASGRTLHLSCVDADTGRPAPGVALETQTLTKISSAGDQEFFKPHSVRVCCDENGRCTIRGLPESGTFRLTRPRPASRNAAGSGSTLPVAQSESSVLDLELESGSPRESWETVRLSSAEVRTARIFGSSRGSEPWFDGPGSVRVMWRSSGAPGPPAVGCELRPDADWELSLPTPAEVELWIERDRRRVSEPVTLALRNEAAIGPIQFKPRALMDVLLHWRHAPEGADLEISAFDAGGAEPIASLPDLTEAGEAPLQLAGPERLSLQLRASEGPLVERSIDWDPARGARIDVDFRPGAPTSIELGGDPELISGASEIWLLGVDPSRSGTVRAAVPIEAGRSIRAVSLPAGRYFWRLRGPEGSFVIGCFDLHEASTARSLRLSCGAQRSRIEDLAPSGGRALEALSVAGVSVESWVPLELRRMDLIGFGVSTSSAAEPHSCWLPADWTYRVLP